VVSGESYVYRRTTDERRLKSSPRLEISEAYEEQCEAPAEIEGLDASQRADETSIQVASRIDVGEGKDTMNALTRFDRVAAASRRPFSTHHSAFGGLTTHRAAVWISLVAVFVLFAPAIAEEVDWRTDYNAARKEAADKSLPLVIDVGTQNCFWCKKLDMTTFRDPSVVSTLNTRFIPLRVDAEREAALAEAIKITSYPTLLLASPDGKILATLEGYVEAGRFNDHLQRVLASLNNPEWMNRDYQDASKAIASADYARAVALLRAINEDGMNRPVQVKAKQLLSDLEQLAAGRLARAKQLDEKGQTSEALNSVSELIRSFAGTQAASEGSVLLTALAAKPEIKVQIRTRRAGELLAQAREDYRTQQFLC
jgi:thioredoxin-related protein